MPQRSLILMMVSEDLSPSSYEIFCRVVEELKDEGVFINNFVSN